MNTESHCSNDSNSSEYSFTNNNLPPWQQKERDQSYVSNITIDEELVPSFFPLKKKLDTIELTNDKEINQIDEISSSTNGEQIKNVNKEIIHLNLVSDILEKTTESLNSNELNSTQNVDKEKDLTLEDSKKKNLIQEEKIISNDQTTEDSSLGTMNNKNAESRLYTANDSINYSYRDIRLSSFELDFKQFFSKDEEEEEKKKRRRRSSIKKFPRWNSSVRVLTQIMETKKPSKGIQQRERLKFLRSNRTLFVWVKCTNSYCGKWRLLKDVDPSEISDKWTCNMNKDQDYNTCDQLQELSFCMSDLTDAKFTAGSLVMAKVPGYPWWPGIVDDDPEFEHYYWLSDKSNNVTHYNVVFFDVVEVTRAWVDKNQIIPFKRFSGESGPLSAKFKRRLQTSIGMAKTALKMNIADRLKNFSFISRFSGPVYSYKHDIHQFVKEHNLPPYYDTDEDSGDEQEKTSQSGVIESQRIKRKKSNEKETESQPIKRFKKAKEGCDTGTNDTKINEDLLSPLSTDPSEESSET